MAILFTFYLVIALATHDALGAADIRLAGLLGLALAWKGWDTFLTGAVPVPLRVLHAPTPRPEPNCARTLSLRLMGPHRLASLTMTNADHEVHRMDDDRLWAIRADSECRLVPGSVGFARNRGARSEPGSSQLDSWFSIT